MKTIICHFDGACEPKNPGGNIGMGATIRMGEEVMLEFSAFEKAHPNNSNNVAEYTAFEKIIDYLIENKLTKHRIEIYGDSMLVVNQMNKHWHIRQGRYVKVAERCLLKLHEHFGNNVKISWISRNQNNHADELSKRELINHNVEFRLQPQPLEYR